MGFSDYEFMDKWEVYHNMKYGGEYFCKHHVHKYVPQIFYFSILKKDNEEQLYISFKLFNFQQGGNKV